MIEIAAARRPVQGHLVCPENQTRETVPRVAHARQIAPRVGRITGMDADGIAMHAPHRFARNFLAGRPALVAQDQLIRRQRDRLAHRGRQNALGERGGGGGGGLFWIRFEKGIAHLLHPMIVHGARAGRAVLQLVRLHKPGQQRPRLLPGGGVGP